jgi:AcrR family transcriptional regulator
MKNMREKILNMAITLFETRGIHASGVDIIIAESGIAKATLYKYFPSKNELIIEYLKEKSNRFYTWINEKLADNKSHSKDVLYLLCDLYEQWITTPEFNGLPFHLGSVEFLIQLTLFITILLCFQMNFNSIYRSWLRWQG